MSAAQVLEQLKKAGIRISRRGESLWVEPREAMPPELVAGLRACKPAVLAVLDELTAVFRHYGNRHAFSDEDLQHDLTPMLADPIGWLQYLRDQGSFAPGAVR